MVYVKGALVGFALWFVTTIVYVVALGYILLRRYVPPPGTEIGFDLSTLIYSPSYWLIAIGAFAVGFYLQFRRT